MRRETRSREKIILDECNYYTQMIASGSNEWAEGEAAQIELDFLLSFDNLQKHGCDISELR